MLLDFACPACKSNLSKITDSQLHCPVDDIYFYRRDGIWRFLLPDRYAYYKPFIDDYEFIRNQEKRGSTDPEYYRALPYRDLLKQEHHGWSIRAQSFNGFIQHVLRPLELENACPLRILELGAGNCWLSNRLSARGHAVAAMDLLDNDWDGLGAFRFYESNFLVVQAEFDLIPFPHSSVDLVIYNASFHYSTDYVITLREALRVIKPNGRIVIIDTPVYRREENGLAMVRKREQDFFLKFGNPGNSLPIKNFLTYQQLTELGKILNIDWIIKTPDFNPIWQLRRRLLAIKQRREVAAFKIIAGRNILP